MRLTFEAIGTIWVIDVFESESKINKSELLKKIKKRIKTFDQTFSRFKKNSVISQIALKPGNYKFPTEAKDLFKIYSHIYKITNGLFTPLIGNLLEQAGYDKNYSFVKKPLSPVISWQSSIKYKHPILTVTKPVLLDFGAAGKGCLVDIVGQMLIDLKIKNFCIDAGGDMLYKNISGKELKVALEDPEDSKKAIGVIKILNQSLCGSAGNRRKWENFHHIINPKTHKSPDKIKATWVIAKNTLIADALATALFFISANKLTPHFEFEYLILNKNRQVEKSNNFKAKIFY